MGGFRTGGPFEFYRYTPSVPAACVFIGLFTVSSVLHTYQIARSRAWVMIPFLLGAYCESIGYIGRILSSSEAPNFTIGPYLLMNMLTLLAPALFAATIYMCLGRIVCTIGGEKYSLVRPSRLTGIFVTGDITGLVVQGAGAGYMAAGTLGDYYTGSKVVIAGLALLVASFGLFVIIALHFDIRMRHAPTAKAMSTALNWRQYLMVLYGGSILIFIRSVFRLVEYAQGNAGWLIRHEWTFYVFDAMLMFAVMVLFNVFHPIAIKAAVDGATVRQKTAFWLSSL
ncbi:hypothetical protein OIDMADRAFT_129749 [Oidiodendron maius Zn]|uniref:RTA1 like protein n=1 Tax=Oidiodendron maius (strain Zn) TaxID=913774 RepID=A0A0C3D720_OIDMZ|nr:hypothetical protein OIDMADRAFT_129749 [Oidiodendron maius Zn]